MTSHVKEQKALVDSYNEQIEEISDSIEKVEYYEKWKEVNGDLDSVYEGNRRGIRTSLLAGAIVMLLGLIISMVGLFRIPKKTTIWGIIIPVAFCLIVVMEIFILNIFG